MRSQATRRSHRLRTALVQLLLSLQCVAFLLSPLARGALLPQWSRLVESVGFHTGLGCEYWRSCGSHPSVRGD